MTFKRTSAVAGWGGVLVCSLVGAPVADTEPVTLATCIQRVLERNPELRVERISPELAGYGLAEAWGAYEPTMLVEARRESATDSGGFDPADFSRDAIYDADSRVARAGITGLVPGGMSYGLSADYAESDGVRNYLNFDSHKASVGGWVRQPLLRNLWMDAPRLQVQVAQRWVRQSQQAYVQRVLEVVHATELAYRDLAAAVEELEVQRRLREARSQLAEAVERLARGGVLTVADEQLARSRVAAAEASVVAAEGVVRRADHALRFLVGGFESNQPGARLEAVEGLPVLAPVVDVEESGRKGLAQRPDLAQVRLEVETASVRRRYHGNQRWPALDLVAGYGRRGASAVQTLPPLPADAPVSDAFDQVSDGVAPSDMVGLVLSIPLGGTSARSAHRASRRAEEQARERVRLQEAIVLREVADAASEVRSAWGRLEPARRAASLARAALHGEERRLEGGTTTVLEVLELQATAALAESLEVQVRAGLARAMATLERAEGTLLERRGVRVVFE